MTDLQRGFPKLEDYGLDPTTVSRWRGRLKDDKKFDEQLEKANERCIKVCETPSNLYPRTVNSGNNEWYTPEKYIEAVRDVLGEIDLDPASSTYAQETVRAKSYFTPMDDGLAQDWHGRVWLNPPYAQPLISQFAAKMAGEVGAGRVPAAIMRGFALVSRCAGLVGHIHEEQQKPAMRAIWEAADEAVPYDGKAGR